MIRESTRARRLAVGLARLGGDVRHAWRTVRRMPGLALVVILSLGVGIGVNTTVFSWVQMLVLRPIPGVRAPAELYLTEPRAETGSHPGVSWPEYQDLVRRLRAIPDLIAFRMVPFNVGEPGRAERTFGELVSGNYFRALELEPAQGRFITADEAARPGGAPVAVVSHGYWRSRLGGAPNAAGTVILVNGVELTVVGVAPDGFQGTHMGLTFDIWVPATMAPTLLAGSRELDDRSIRGYSAMGRLAPGASLDDALAEYAAFMNEMARAHPATNAGVQGLVLTFWEAARGPQRFLLPALRILQGIMLLLLLAVCANTANLMLARASARQREIGVRAALGAGRGSVMRLLLAESLLLALLGGGLGAAIAVWGTNALRAVPVLGAFPIRFQTSIDAIGLGFAILLGVLSGLLFGAAPALQLARIDPLRAIRAGARTASRSRMRSWIMGVEVGLALVVLVAAGYFLRTFGQTQDTDPGFTREGVLLAGYDLSNRGLGESETLTFATSMLDGLRAVRGVEAAAVAMAVPLDIHGLPLRGFTLEGRARAESGEDQALFNVVSPGYFQTLGIPLVAGRDFAELRDAAAPPQAIVNQAFVDRYLEGGEPLGRRVTVASRTAIITGVAKTTVNDAFGEDPTPIIYLSWRERPGYSGQIHVRSRPGSELALTPELRRVVSDLDASVPLFDVRTMAQHIERNLFLKRIPARMFVVLGPLLLALAAIGIYAVVAYSVARRTSEIGVRLALGATTKRVITDIVRESLRIVTIGATVGWLVAYMVYIHAARGRPLDLPVFLGVPVLLLLVAAVASWLPARRVTRVDPMLALREE